MTSVLGEYPATFAMVGSGPAMAAALGEYPAALAMAVSIPPAGKSCYKGWPHHAARPFPAGMSCHMFALVESFCGTYRRRDKPGLGYLRFLGKLRCDRRFGVVGR